MKFPTGSIHVVWASRNIKTGQLKPKSLCMTRLNSSFGPCFKKLLNAFVPEALYHG